LESETIIWAQDLHGTGITVNALVPGGPTLTGMIPNALPEDLRGTLLDPEIMVPPLQWLVSNGADTITGCRVIANLWDEGNPSAAVENSGWSNERKGGCLQS
jgi:NAD(P)-dependent dehydrogenase (short-subunit alcohol dehydrogenase family)